MIIPLSWIKEFIDVNLPTSKLAEKLLLSGTKVESVKKEKDDFIFEFEITPNRPDCLSVIGIVREISAITGSPLKIPPVQSIKTFGKIPFWAKGSSCPNYSLALIENIQVEPAPGWMRTRLEKSGIRSINNIVDITNYVMLESGQPMHAFDQGKIKGKILVRESKEGEKLTTLDGVIRKLPKGSIVIEDEKELIDLAGLMGGKASEVDQNTKTILLLVPLYEPIRIRKTSLAIGLRTEASNRFEKKLDLTSHETAAYRAVSLIKELCPASRVIAFESKNNLQKSLSTPWSTENINEILGTNIKRSEIMKILSILGFGISNNKIIVPSWRRDVEEEIDLVEEIGRITGYNNLPPTLPFGEISTPNEVFDFDWEQKIREILVSLGMTEVYTATLVGKVAPLSVTNPLLVDYKYLRSSLIPGLLEALKTNLPRYEKIAIFEIGRVFPEQKLKSAQVPLQPKKIAVAFLGEDLRAAKGKLETLFVELGIKPRFVPHPLLSRKANIKSEDLLFGSFEQSTPQAAVELGLPDEVYLSELDLAALTQAASDKQYKKLPEFPPTIEDISFTLPTSAYLGQVFEQIKRIERVARVELIDMYQDSRTLRIWYQDPTKTLTSPEVAKIRNKILRLLQTKFGARIK